MFTEVDKDHSGEVNFDEFQSEFGQGSVFVPEFLKPRSLRQSRGGPIWRWDIQCQGSNAKRPFEIIDKNGHKRYHCKASHSYKLPKAFTEDAIAKRIHLCREEMEKLEARQALEADAECEASKHDRITRPRPFVARPPRSRAASSAAGLVDRPRSCRPPWAVNPVISDTYKFRIDGVVPAN